MSAVVEKLSGFLGALHREMANVVKAFELPALEQKRLWDVQEEFAESFGGFGALVLLAVLPRGLAAVGSTHEHGGRADFERAAQALDAVGRLHGVGCCSQLCGASLLVRCRGASTCKTLDSRVK
eukprot:2151650-Amphidinium_carterae.1